MSEQYRSEGVPLSREDRYRMDELIEEVQKAIAEITSIGRRTLDETSEVVEEEVIGFAFASTAAEGETPGEGKGKYTVCERRGSGDIPSECVCYDGETGECRPGRCEEHEDMPPF